MLTRLKVNGFKNLVDVDVRFGPFTCIAGGNGTGKSNLFDAIRFLSALADKPLMEAALAVRGVSGRAQDIRNLFHHIGDDYVDEMSFEAEMITQHGAPDDAGAPANSNITCYRYHLVIAYRPGAYGAGYSAGFQTQKLEVVDERLIALSAQDARGILPQGNVHPAWLTEYVNAELEQSVEIIATTPQQVWLGSELEPLHSLPRSSSATMLSNMPGFFNPLRSISISTKALLARREMQSWRTFQFESSAIGSVEEFLPGKPGALSIGERGENLASAIYRIAQISGDPQRVYSQLGNRLAELVDDVRAVRVEYDEAREVVRLQVTDRHGTTHSARALSDGTLRFLVFAAMELDSDLRGILCIEEPDNGLHPARIPAMLDLLQAIAVDPSYPVDADNPLRQVIINTHSPSVVLQVPDESLLLTELRDTLRGGRRFSRAQFACLPDTWRAKAPEGVQVLSKGDLLSYFNPASHKSDARNRVIDRGDLRVLWAEPEQ